MNLDVRFMLYLMDTLVDQNRLLKEMEITGSQFGLNFLKD